MASDHPGKYELEDEIPLCGPTGKLTDRRLELARDRVRDVAAPVRRQDVSWTNAILCEIPGGKLNVLHAHIRKANQKRKKEGRPLLLTPEECCRPRLMRELRAHPNALLAGSAVTKSVLQAPTLSIVANRGGPIFASLGPDDALTQMSAEAWADLDRTVRGDDTPGRVARQGSRRFVGAGAASLPDGRQLLRLLPTFNPAMVVNEKRHTGTLQADVDKAFRWFRDGDLKWKRPEITLNPSPRELRAWLRNPSYLQGPTTGKPIPFISFDLETTRDDPLNARINCIGLGNLESAMVIQFASIHDEKAPTKQMMPIVESSHAGNGEPTERIQRTMNGDRARTTYYSPEQEAEIIEIIAAALLDPKLLKVGWNSRSFDAAVMKSRWGILPRFHIDLIIAHKLCASELPHGLGYAVSVELDVGAWKAEHTGTEAKTDEELCAYNGTDDVVTAQMAPILLPRIVERRQWHLLARDMRAQDLARNIHENGVFIDQKERRRLETHYQREAEFYRNLCCNIAGYKFNPGSYPQLQDLIYGKWGLKEIDVTDMGAPRVDDTVMRAHFLDGAIPAERRVLFDAVRRFRRAQKYLGTYVVKLRPANEHVEGFWAEWDEEIEDEDLRAEMAAESWRPGKVLPDGRYHYEIKAHVAVTGRLASPIQSMPRKLRSMVIPAPGRGYVYADMDQLELRFASALWGAVAYLTVFKNKLDAHALTAEMLYGDEWRRAKPHSEDWERMRDFAKRFAYAVLYGAEDLTVHDVIVSVENDDGKLIYADVSLRETRNRRRNWLEANPEIEKGWAHQVEKFRRQGFLADPVAKRRRDFLDGENFNELVNFEVQAGGSAIVRDACFEIEDEVPHGYRGPGTGFVGEFHDAVLLEAPLSDIERVQGVVQRAMTRRVAGLDVDFTAKAVIKKAFQELKKAA